MGRRKSTQQSSVASDVASWVSVNTETAEQQAETSASAQYTQHLCESDDASLVGGSQSVDLSCATNSTEDRIAEVAEGFSDRSGGSSGESVKVLQSEHVVDACRCDSTLGHI